MSKRPASPTDLPTAAGTVTKAEQPSLLGPGIKPGALVADNTGAAQAGSAAASSAPTDDRAPSGELGAAPVADPNLGTVRTAVGLYRDIVSHIQAIEQLASSPCLVPNGPDEEAEFDQLHVQITTRLAQILHSLTDEG